MSGKTDVIKAVQRLGWRFSKACKGDGKFYVNGNDIKALNFIAEYVQDQQKRQYIENELFAKLYIKVYQRMIEHFKSDVFDPVPRRELHRILENSLEGIIHEFTQALNDSEVYFMLNKAKVKNGVIPDGTAHAHLSHLKTALEHSDLPPQKKVEKYLQYKKEKDENSRKWRQLYKENPDACLGDVWDYENVKECLIAEVNNAINILQ